MIDHPESVTVLTCQCIIRNSKYMIPKLTEMIREIEINNHSQRFQYSSLRVNRSRWQIIRV